jgi:hypothetical protein
VSHFFLETSGLFLLRSYSILLIMNFAYYQFRLLGYQLRSLSILFCSLSILLIINFAHYQFCSLLTLLFLEIHFRRNRGLLFEKPYINYSPYSISYFPYSISYFPRNHSQVHPFLLFLSQNYVVYSHMFLTLTLSSYSFPTDTFPPFPLLFSYFLFLFLSPIPLPQVSPPRII